MNARLENRHRAEVLFHEHRQRIYERTDRMFAGLMVLQWFAGVAAAAWISPRTWLGVDSATHPHVWAALLLGGLISSLPIALALLRPGRPSTRYVIAVAQMLWSSLLIHLSGGRIETHFHVFGSLAFLAFYRDWKVLVPATIVVAADHFLRGVYWPQSVFGILTASPWRWVEHAAWVAFEDFFLALASVQSVHEMRDMARQQAQLEAVNQKIERTVSERTAQLRASQERFREAFSSAPIGMALVAPDGQLLQVNRALCQMLGYTEPELLETTFQAVTDPDDSDSERDSLEELFSRSVQVLQREKRCLHKDGHVVWISLSISMVRDAEGRPLYRIAQIQDVTASKRAHADLQQAKEAAEAASDAKSEFLAMMSHELRTPLNIIIGYTNLMADLAFGPLTAEQASTLDRVEKGAVQLLELITASLDLSKLEAGRDPVARQAVDPAALLSEIDVETQDLQRKPEIEVVWQVEPDLPSLHTDPAKLKIVIKNLVGNAIKFTDSGRVVVSARASGPDLLFEVADTGIGISPEVLPIVFEPFRQGDGSSTRRHDGVGLGLYIVSRLVRLLDGSLSVESALERGSVFMVRMPTASEDQPQNDASAPKRRLAAA